MRKWVFKAILQKFFTLAPGGFKLNYWFQKHVTKAVRLSDDFFETMLTQFAELETYAYKNKLALKEQEIFEIGTGWHAIAPLCFYLSGAKNVTTVDLNNHLRKENVVELFLKFIHYHRQGKLQKWLPNLQLERLELLEKLATNTTNSAYQLLAAVNIKPHVLDAAKTPFAQGSFGFCYSINVFEHIAQEALPGISQELSRITKPGGAAYHAIGVYDHFAHVDPSLSKFNYLRFSQRQWALIDNDIQPQNRLRLSYFRELFLGHNWTIEAEIFNDPEPQEIAKIKLHPDWENVPDLDIAYGSFLLKKAAS